MENLIFWPCYLALQQKFKNSVAPDYSSEKNIIVINFFQKRKDYSKPPIKVDPHTWGQFCTAAWFNDFITILFDANLEPHSNIYQQEATNG